MVLKPFYLLTGLEGRMGKYLTRGPKDTQLFGDFIRWNIIHLVFSM